MLQLILGGARSGKSRLAEKLASDSALPVIYIATSQPLDGEMNQRVALHRQRRPDHWGLIEEPIELARVLRENAAPERCLLVDCLTLWLTNQMMAEAPIAPAVADLIESLAESPAALVVISNEVGQGIVPDNALARRFRDEAGWMHQKVAAAADRVEVIWAGLPLSLKG